MSEMIQEDDEDKELVPVDTPIEEPKEDTLTSEHDDEDYESDKEDSRLSEDNEDREELRRKRREEKAERAQRRKSAIERDKAELNLLRQQNEELARRVAMVEKTSVNNVISNIDARLAEKIAEVKAAERIIARASTEGNGEDVVKAMRIRDQAIFDAQQLNGVKQQQAKIAEQAGKVNNSPDPVIGELSNKWFEKNKWFDPKGRNEASKIALAIDETLLNEGFNPKTEDYWQELDRRVTRRLPELKGVKEVDERAGPKGPRVGSGRETQTSSSKQIYISPERKQAMIDAGIWDDPEARQRMLKRYQNYDKNNPTR